MPAKGQAINLNPYSLVLETDVLDAVKASATKAMRTFLSIMMGDPSEEYSGYGIKRAAFRHVDLMATAAGTMLITLRKGTAIMNDGEPETGNLYLVYAGEDEKTITMPEAHATLDRYDIIYATPKTVGTDSVTREHIDADGNLYNDTYNRTLTDDFDLAVQAGTPGAGFPKVSGVNLNPRNAFEYVASGRIPIAVVKVTAATTVINQADLTDLREPFQYRAFPVNATDDGIEALQPIQQPNHIGQLYRLNDIAFITAIPQTTLYLDCTGANPILKYCDHASNHHTVDLTAV